MKKQTPAESLKQGDKVMSFESVTLQNAIADFMKQETADSCDFLYNEKQITMPCNFTGNKSFIALSTFRYTHNR